MVNRSLTTLQRRLRASGFDPGPIDGIYGPRTRRAVVGFQQAWAGGKSGSTARLRVDGVPGPLTYEAAQDLPRVSPHFSSTEFRSRGDGLVVLRYQLVDGLEALREALGGHPLVVVSGYRDPAHNAAVGGAARSQHLYGAAADLSYPCSLDTVRSLRVFSGLGHKGGRIRHVDVRHVTRELSGIGGSINRPTTWAY